MGRDRRGSGARRWNLEILRMTLLGRPVNPTGRTGSVAPVNARVWATVMALGLFGGLGVAPSQARTTAEPHEVKSCSVPDIGTGTRTCTYTFVHTDTIETFVVPATTKGPIQITATGAPGFGEDATKSRGAVVTGTFNFLSGTPLFVVVGGDGYYD